MRRTSGPSPARLPDTGGMNPAALAALQARFGEQLSTVHAVREAHARDESRMDYHLPDAVLHVQSEQDLVDALRIAGEYLFPIVPFSVGSSLEGQVIPVRGGLTLNLLGMNRVLAIEPGGFQATVQPGVTYPELNRQARRHGLFFPVDPGAEASLGGMASTNASGTGAVKYGTTRARCDERGLNASFVGHVGDGNFHVLFHAAPDDRATWDAIHATYDEMMTLTLAAGGTCSGEHGIGLHKQKYLAQERADTLELMREVKALFDPQGLLNPGKIF